MPRQHSAAEDLAPKPTYYISRLVRVGEFSSPDRRSSTKPAFRTSSCTGRVHWYEADFGARALANAEPGPDGVRRLRTEDDLAALMLYQARDGFAGLRHPTDIAAWWDAHGTASRPRVLEPIAHQHPALRRALTASAVLLERLVGVPAARLIELPARVPWGARRAIALANPLMRGRPQQITAEVSLVDGLLSPKGERVAFFRRRALPSDRELPASDHPIVVARMGHALRVARRYVVAAVRSRPRLGGPN